MISRFVSGKPSHVHDPHRYLPLPLVRPELVCEVRFTAWTGGHLRHPIFVGMLDGER
jgi:hypothetical protein